MTRYHPSTLSVAERINDGIADGPHGRIEFCDGERPSTLDAEDCVSLAEALIEAVEAIDELLADWRSTDPLAHQSRIYQRAQHALDTAREPAHVLTTEAAQ